MLIDFRGRLVTIDPAKFVAKRPWQNSYSHGYRAKKLKPNTGDLSRLWAKGPANLMLMQHATLRFVYTRAVRGLLQINVKKRKSRHRESEETLVKQTRHYSMWTSLYGRRHRTHTTWNTTTSNANKLWKAPAPSSRTSFWKSTLQNIIQSCNMERCVLYTRALRGLLQINIKNGHRDRTTEKRSGNRDVVKAKRDC